MYTYICVHEMHTHTDAHTNMQALSKNGKIYGNGIMVGVQPCIDKVLRTVRAKIKCPKGK